MKKTIQRLRKKEQFEKDKIALVGATVITLVIALAWLIGITTIKNPSESQMANTSTPFQNIKEDISQLFSSFKK
jgi:uncharacterized membrane protein